MPPASNRPKRAAARQAEMASNDSPSPREDISTVSDDASSRASGSTNSKQSRRDSGAVVSNRTKTNKRAQVKHACYQCRSTKLRCSGDHPECMRCMSRGLACEYEVPSEDITRMQHLRNQVTENRRELKAVTALIDLMRFGTDQQATEALARFRTGDSIEFVLQQAFAEDFRNQIPSVQHPVSSQTLDNSQMFNASWHHTDEDVQMQDEVNDQFWDPLLQQPMQ